ncbi:MAG: GNAT family N-acetyltransferase [Gudongella sp.]|nr:GNAT family N-acetyltransferase [Gudongella sp.]
MITRLDKKEWSMIVPFLKENILENYFNILGLVSEKEIYEDIYVQHDKDEKIVSVLFIRKSGTLKFYAPSSFDYIEISNFLGTINFKNLIGPNSYCSLIKTKNILTKSKKLTELCHLKSYKELETNYSEDICLIEFNELYKVIEIYNETFKSFASIDVLQQRILTSRGRIVGIYDNSRLVSVAGTDFETDNASLIVGVATIPEHRNKGYATKLVKYLSNILQNENKQVFLEYENPIAGKIYKDIGYCIVDSVYKYWD